MKTYTPHVTYSASRPRVGDDVTYKGQPLGTVLNVDKCLCWTSGSTEGPFIWCFKDGLNNLHEWPNKEPGKNAP